MARAETKQRSPRLGVGLNRLCLSLLEPHNAKAFARDEEAYLTGWALTQTERRAIQERDYPLLVSLGANIYLLAKLGALDGNETILRELYSVVTRIKPEG